VTDVQAVPFGTRAFAAVAAAKKAKPAAQGAFTGTEASIILEDLYQAETAPLRREITDLTGKVIAKDKEIEVLKASPKRSRGVLPAGNRPRNPLFDELAQSTGTDPLLATKPKLREIAVALADIKAVCPDLTVEEIRRRAAAYQEAHPPGTDRHWTLTAKALAKYWGDLARDQRGERRTREAALDVYQTPPVGWEAVAIRLFGEGMRDKGWPEIRIAYGLEILKEMANHP
jgi:hypothetical protein